MPSCPIGKSATTNCATSASRRWDLARISFRRRIGLVRATFAKFAKFWAAVSESVFCFYGEFLGYSCRDGNDVNFPLQLKTTTNHVNLVNPVGNETLRPMRLNRFASFSRV